MDYNFLNYNFEITDRDLIERTLEYEGKDINENYENRFYKGNIKRNNDGTFSLEIYKKEGSFTHDEVIVANSFLEQHNRKLDSIIYNTMTVELNKTNDIKIDSMIDVIFCYQKSYKTLTYARMIVLGIINGMEEYHYEEPDVLKLYDYY